MINDLVNWTLLVGTILIGGPVLAAIIIAFVLFALTVTGINEIVRGIKWLVS